MRWEKQDDDTLLLSYLNTRDDDPLNQDPLTITLENPSLTLAGDGPFAGDHRRDASGVGTLEGQVVLPDDAEVPDTSVLVLTLRDQGAADATPVVQRLTRLVVEDGKMPFRLYYNGDMIDDTHRYVVDARVILDGAVQFQLEASMLHEERTVTFADGTDGHGHKRANGVRRPLEMPLEPMCKRRRASRRAARVLTCARQPV